MSARANQTDQELLTRYARHRADEDFAELVRRHVNLVYSAALRQVRATQLAEEVSQMVFTDLARVAGKLQADTVLTAWLYQVTRHTAIDVVRREARRQLREQIATQMNATNAPDASWTDIEPLLDEAVSALDEADRTAVLLRFFENKSLRVVGQQLGISDDAAQKRVSRAVERLREFFAKRGVTVGASGWVAAVSANAVQAAPIGLALTISSTAALSVASLATPATATTANALAMTTLQKTIITTTIAVLAGVGVYEFRQNARLREQVQNLQKQSFSANQELREAHENITAQLNAMQQENEQLRRSANDVARLRGEVARLRSNPPTTLAEPPPTTTAAASTNSPVELPIASWNDVGFATPHAALQTRGWSVLNGNRDRFKESIFITADARQTLEDMFIKMAEASNDPNKAQMLEELLKNQFGVEEGILMPMMAEHQHRGYQGYRILSEQTPDDDHVILQLETRLNSGPPKHETVKMQRFASDWKIVIDQDFIKMAR